MVILQVTTRINNIRAWVWAVQLWFRVNKIDQPWDISHSRLDPYSEWDFIIASDINTDWRILWMVNGQFLRQSFISVCIVIICLFTELYRRLIIWCNLSFNYHLYPLLKKWIMVVGFVYFIIIFYIKTELLLNSQNQIVNEVGGAIL